MCVCVRAWVCVDGGGGGGGVMEQHDKCRSTLNIQIELKRKET